MVGQADADALIKPKAFVVLKQADGGGPALTDELMAHCKKTPGALQISALGRVRGRAAQDRDRQDPALPAALLSR